LVEAIISAVWPFYSHEKTHRPCRKKQKECEKKDTTKEERIEIESVESKNVPMSMRELKAACRQVLATSFTCKKLFSASRCSRAHMLYDMRKVIW
jgi:hypothetical protein